jgi:single-strand DNA-binding protein
MNYNKVILVGRLVREPETVMLPSGTQISNLVVAYNRNYKTPEGEWKEESHFFEVKVFGRLVENVIPRLGRGDLVLIEGRLHQDKWLDKQTGSPRSKVRIVALDIKLLGKAGATRTQPLETPAEEIELPSFEEEELLPPKVEKNQEEQPLEEMGDLEKLLFGEEEERKPEGEKKDKKDDLDDFDILL